jgi:hypothetical protein
MDEECGHNFLSSTSQFRSRAPANSIGDLLLMVQDEDTQSLVWLRLIGNRAKIYLALLELGKASAGQLSKRIKIPQPEVDNALLELKK